MKMKKYLASFLAVSMMMTMTGCISIQQENENTALSAMEKINSKNILQLDTSSRLWYEISPEIFVNQDTGTSGSLKTLLQDLAYISDGDPDTTEDLNLSGLLLSRFVETDQEGAPLDIASMNPAFGSEDDLTALCSAAGAVNVPVMITLPLNSVSKENAYFKKMIETVNGAGDQDPAGIDPDLMDMFYVEPNHADENGWTRIGQSEYYYGSLASSDIPRLNLESTIVRNQIIEQVERYLNDGVGGFFIPDYKDLIHGDAGKNAEFATWFEQVVKDRNPNAITVFASIDWNDEMGSVPAYLADASASGADGMIAKAATGAITARDLGAYLADTAARTQGVSATLINDDEGSLDLLKSSSRAAQYKMALAVTLMSSGQVFIESGDELGLKSTQSDILIGEMEPEEEDQEDETENELEFGSLSEQKENGDSILNFVQQAILLRDSYLAISSGSVEFNGDLSTDQVMVLHKQKDNSEVVLAFNLSDQPQDLDVSSITIHSLPAELGGCLLSGTEGPVQEGTTIHLPAYSMTLLK